MCRVWKRVLRAMYAKVHLPKRAFILPNLLHESIREKGRQMVVGVQRMILLLILFLLFAFPFRKFFITHWRSIVPLIIGGVVGVAIFGLAAPSLGYGLMGLAGILFVVATVQKIWKDFIK